MDELENHTLFELKKDLKKLLPSVRKKNGLLTYYESNGSDIYEYILKSLIQLDKRLDKIEARFDEIDKAFQDSLERFPS
jgi:hypothetical protein